MIALLDINVLIARADQKHALHHRAVKWMASTKNLSIATCPLTENGFVRIYGNPNYPEGPGHPAGAVQILSAIRGLPQHVFIPDSISIADTTFIPTTAGMGHQQLTDLYLLALAVAHSATFVTFDRRIDPSSVIGGRDSLVIIT